MPELLASLLTRDMGYLRICASFWGMELNSSVREQAADELAELMLTPQAVKDVLSSLPAEALSALQALIQASGRLSWAVFIRQWGEVRLVGPGRRDREQVHLQPVSPAEILVYRSLVANAFFDTTSGLQEFAYIPEDLLPVLRSSLEPAGPPAQGDNVKIPPGRPATSRECARVLPASDGLLDDAVTLLAAMRLSIDSPGLTVPWGLWLRIFCAAPAILQGNDPSPERVRNFSSLPPARSLAWLVEVMAKE